MPIGVRLMSAFLNELPQGEAPLLLFAPIPIFVFYTIIFICVAPGGFSSWRILLIEPTIVFRT